MISGGSRVRIFPDDLPRITAKELIARSGTDLRASWIDVETPGGQAYRLRIERVPITFGARVYLCCPACDRHVQFLLLAGQRLVCRLCIGVQYAGQVFSRAKHWEAWGRYVRPLLRVRKVLAKRGLRLARRGRLERLETHLQDKVIAGLQGSDALERPPRAPPSA